MVENSLGRTWLVNNPNTRLKSGWDYYVDEVEQAEDVIKELEKICFKNVNPEEITFLDPCCGSGHILVYAFDVFYDMYLEKGYIESEIPKLILENNLFGLDVDDRAVQMASFAVMMKAREKSRRVFRESLQPQICSIQESNWLTDEMVNMFSAEDNRIRELLIKIRDTFLDAKEYGSLLNLEPSLYNIILVQRIQEYKLEQADLIEMIEKQMIELKLPQLLKQLKILSRKYDVVCTNPPYMGRNGINSNVTKFLDENYKDSKADLFAAFIERAFSFAKEHGYISMITMESWMFLSSYEKLREKIIDEKTILRMIHMPYLGKGRTSLGINFGTSAFVLYNHHIVNYCNQNMCIKYDEIDEEGVPLTFPVRNERYQKSRAEDFRKVPGSLIAYWISQSLINNFDEPSVGTKLTTREGMATADNNRFLRYWFEVKYPSITFGCKNIQTALQLNGKWFPYNKGGVYRKWYGNNDYIVNWENDGFDIRNNIDTKTGRIRSHNYNGEFGFRKGITWSALSSGSISLRYSDYGFLFDSKGAKGFCEDENDLKYILGLINSKIGTAYLEFISPTMDFKVGDVIQIPLLISNQDHVVSKVNENIEISKTDWDSFELSWDFKKHPLVEYSSSKIENAFKDWERFAETQFNQLKANEEELNRIFIEIYRVEDQMIPEEDDKAVTIRKAELERDVKGLISYAIGCSFGRYSLDESGLIYAGGEFNPSRYKTFPVDKDNILPILPGSYFDDDIVSRLVDFICVTFGKETLGENLDFIAEAIGQKKGETARDTLRRYFLNEFYKDHLQLYKKRPIYWLFSSGKEKAFNCLVYMHRYDKTTLSRIRTDYLHEYQIRLEAEKRIY